MSTTHPSDDSKEEVLEQFPDPRRNTLEATGDSRRHSDARSIREHHGVPSYSPEAFRYEGLIPNVLEYEWQAGRDRIAGGTDLLGVGKPGSGKSTLLNHLAVRAIEVSRSRVVWRASTNRSEWLPLAPWATVAFPEGVQIDARLVPRVPTEPVVSLTFPDDLERIAREVVFYDDVRDLNENHLAEGQIHVVYPDPLLRGCQEALEASEEKTYDSPKDRTLFDADDPSKHFWFGWVLDRVERGPHYWTTLILDEIGDVAPEDASKDSFGTYQKIELLRDCWVDARKKGLSIYGFGHAERDVHNLIRHKVRWRVRMNGMANPTTASRVVGFERVPMETEMTSRMSVGEALIFNEQNFEKIGWPDYSTPVSHKLEVSMGGGGPA